MLLDKGVGSLGTPGHSTHIEEVAFSEPLIAGRLDGLLLLVAMLRYCEMFFLNIFQMFFFEW